jgi:hypothetical protein
MAIFPVNLLGLFASSIDYPIALSHTGHMSRASKKFIAVLMLLWLPLFTGSALAASVSMQLPQGSCHEAAMSHEPVNMSEHHMHHGDIPSPSNDKSSPCNNCGVCHLACTGYLLVPNVVIAVAQANIRESTPYLVASHSFTSAPLLPPPLVRA